MSYPEEERDTRAARGLGWASLAIGLTELAAPGQVQAMLGLDDRPEHRTILRVLGGREVLHGLSILTEREPTTALSAGLWSRVAGDVLDNAVLGVAATKTRQPARFAAVVAVVGVIGVLDVLYAVRVERHRRAAA